MKKTIFLIFILVSSVIFSQENSVEVPKIVIKIPLGESIHLENVSIKFVEVLEDSRCPKNVTCVWAGRARVLVEVTESGNHVQQKELLFGQTKKGEIINNILFTTEDSEIKGMTLKPHPTSEIVEDKDPFILLIYIDRH